MIVLSKNCIVLSKNLSSTSVDQNSTMYIMQVERTHSTSSFASCFKTPCVWKEVEEYVCRRVMELCTCTCNQSSVSKCSCYGSGFSTIVRAVCTNIYMRRFLTCVKKLDSMCRMVTQLNLDEGDWRQLLTKLDLGHFHCPVAVFTAQSRHVIKTIFLSSGLLQAL